MDSRAEGELRLVTLVCRDVECLWLCKHVRIAVRFSDAHTHERACRKEHVAILDVDTGEAGCTAHGAEVAHCFLDRALGQLGPLGQHRPLLGVMCKEGKRAPELISRCVGTADDDGVHHHDELVSAQAIARLLHSDQVGEQVVGWLVASVCDERAGVLVELLLRSHDEVQLAGHIDGEDLENVVGPPAEQLPVLLRRTQQFTDDRDGIRLTNVGRDVGASSGCNAVDEFVDDIAHCGPKPLGLTGGEGRGDQPSQTQVDVALGGKDADALARQEPLVGNTHHFRQSADGTVPALVAQDAGDVVVAPHVVPKDTACQPGVRRKLCLVRMPFIERDSVR